MKPDPLEPPSGDFTWLQMLDDRSDRLVKLRTRLLQRGDEKAYHDIRVATRRLQELVAFLNPFLPQRRARRLWRRARRIRRVVSDTRNADVMRLLVEEVCPGLERAHARSLKKLCAASLPNPRRRTPRSLPQVRKRIAALHQRFHEPASDSVRTRAEHLLQERLARLEKARRAAASGAPRPMHRLRIAVKHYRYLLELLAPLGLSGAEAVLEQARTTQHTLGQLHDLDMLQELLERHGAPAEVRQALRRERQRRLRESRQAVAALPAIDLQWKRPARRTPR